MRARTTIVAARAFGATVTVATAFRATVLRLTPGRRTMRAAIHPRRAIVMALAVARSIRAAKVGTLPRLRAHGPTVRLRSGRSMTIGALRVKIAALAFRSPAIVPAEIRATRTIRAARAELIAKLRHPRSHRKRAMVMAPVSVEARDRAALAVTVLEFRTRSLLAKALVAFPLLVALLPGVPACHEALPHFAKTRTIRPSLIARTFRCALRLRLVAVAAFGTIALATLRPIALRATSVLAWSFAARRIRTLGVGARTIGAASLRTRAAIAVAALARAAIFRAAALRSAGVRSTFTAARFAALVAPATDHGAQFIRRDLAVAVGVELAEFVELQSAIVIRIEALERAEAAATGAAGAIAARTAFRVLLRRCLRRLRRAFLRWVVLGEKRRREKGEGRGRVENASGFHRG